MGDRSSIAGKLITNQHSIRNGQADGMLRRGNYRRSFFGAAALPKEIVDAATIGSPTTRLHPADIAECRTFLKGGVNHPPLQLRMSDPPSRNTPARDLRPGLIY